MNLLPRSRAAGRGRPTLQLTSMIDVIFLLLIYFILTSTYQPPESHVSPALLADSSGAGRSELTPQVVEVGVFDGSPGFRIGSNTLRTRRELADLLARLPRQQGVIIRASDAATTHWAASALRAARDAGFTKVTYVPAR